MPSYNLPLRRSRLLPLPISTRRSRPGAVPSSLSLEPAAASGEEEDEERYSHLLQRCAQTSDVDLGRSIHTNLLKLCIIPSSLFLHNHLLNMYSKCGDPSSSLQMLDEMPQRNVVSWSAAIAGLVQCGRPKEALSLFVRMRQDDTRPNEFTLVSLLNVCALSEGSAQAYWIYTLVIRFGFESNVFLMNAFLTALVRNGELAEAVELFEKSRDKDVVSWNSMLAGYLELSCLDVWRFWCRMNREGVRPNEFTFSSVLTGLAACPNLKDGLQVHAQLVKSGYGEDICVGNSLVDMYLKNHVLFEGMKAFDEMPQRDVVSWTQIVAGCLLCGQPTRALQLVKTMMRMGVRPNKFTLATMFNVCSSLVSLEEGKKAHVLRIKLGDDADICVDNALIDMYAKCGSTDGAWRVFELMKEQSTISWTTMIMAFAQNGLPRDALRVFNMMILKQIQPNSATFICVLYACSQGGFVDEGWEYFASMTKNFGIDPGEDHYACMVDLLGRAGRTAEAEALIQSMPFQPGVLVWQTLLGACRVHGDVETGKRAAEKALAQDRQDSSTYLLLSNMLADSSNWAGVGSIRDLMENTEVTKMPGCSWIQVNGSN